MLNDIVFALGLMLKLCSAYFAIVMLFAVFKPKTPAKSAPRTRFAVLIPARNEETVIGDLVRSLYAQDYPRALFDVYAVPNNCTDNTRQAAVDAGAMVIDCWSPVKCKGDAMNQAFEQLSGKGYDAYCVFDADNIVDSRFLSEMNNAFCAGARVAKGRNVARNPHDSWISGCYGIYFGIFNLFYNRARANIGMSAKLVGTGFAVHRDVIDSFGGWHTSTIAEDAEFAISCAISGERVAWVPAAVAYDEEPNSFRLSLKQRRRWCSGIMQVSALKLGRVLSAGGGSFRLRLDAAMFLIAPFVQALSVIPLGMMVVKAALGGISGLETLLLTASLSYLGAAATAAAVVTLSRGWSPRIIKSVLMFPLFMLSWLPLQVSALLRKTTSWEQISHARDLPQRGARAASRLLGRKEKANPARGR